MEGLEGVEDPVGSVRPPERRGAIFNGRESGRREEKRGVWSPGPRRGRDVVDRRCFYAYFFCETWFWVMHDGASADCGVQIAWTNRGRKLAETVTWALGCGELGKLLFSVKC